jgi:hypothetical protein
MDFFDLLLIFIAGVALGWYWHAHRMFVMLRRNPRPMIDILERVRDLEDNEDKDAQIIECQVEWHNGHCYLWNKDNGDFLGQGADLESAIRGMRGLKPNTEYHIPADLANKP